MCGGFVKEAVAIIRPAPLAVTSLVFAGFMPRIEHRHARLLEVAGVSGDDRQPVIQLKLNGLLDEVRQQTRTLYPSRRRSTSTSFTAGS
jgi:hypothetical protein